METRYYPAQTIVKEALCDNCGTILKYVKSDFSKPKFSWLHCCEKCHKEYWLDNRYPLTDYCIDINSPLLQLETDPIPFEVTNEPNHNSLYHSFNNRHNHQHQAQGLTMNFIKLGKRYINLDAIAAVVPRQKGLGYTVNFIGGTQMDICEMDMADIRRTLEMASTREVVLDKAKCKIGGVEYFKRGASHE